MSDAMRSLLETLWNLGYTWGGEEASSHDQEMYRLSGTREAYDALVRLGEEMQATFKRVVEKGV